MQFRQKLGKSRVNSCGDKTCESDLTSLLEGVSGPWLCIQQAARPATRATLGTMQSLWLLDVLSI